MYAFHFVKQSHHRQCVVANFDATKDSDLAAEYNVQGFPTMKFFPKGDKSKIVEYQQGRTEEDFIEFLNEHCGTFRTVGGGLNEKVRQLIFCFPAPHHTVQAGRISELDQIVKDVAAKGIEETIKEAKDISGKFQSKYAEYYVKALEKLQKNAGYVDKEISRLSGIISSGNTVATKLDDFTMRRNILQAFKGSDEEAVDDARDEL